ncbi:MAG: (2Fe-2S)-binding protein [Candidatus Marinimicrobia bacterium]|nr:(2Fe-2S)-binding protein [Candidatus Neomarinimicrobiota bacterium]
MSDFILNINGEEKRVNVDGEIPLLWVLRDFLGYTGTKYSCGRGLCGACTIHIDGEAIRSCVTPTDNLDEDVKITTIEGLSENDNHPVKKAWLKKEVPQCGYCQSGQIMTAAAFLDRNPNPTNSDIDTAMKMNICRCGTYPEIKKAILSVANDKSENKDTKNE